MPRNSRFTHLLPMDANSLCLSQALTQQQIYGDQRLKEVHEHFETERSLESFQQRFRDKMSPGEIKEILAVLQKDKFLISAEQEDIFDYITPETTIRNRGYRLLRVLLTDVCNLACSYCKVMPNIIEVTKRATSNENLERAVKIFFEGSHPDQPKIIHITGGEPLIRWDSVVYTVNLVEKYCRSYEKYFIVLGTNGMLLSAERVRFLARHNVKAIVSLDGKEETHNTLRQDHRGKGSYQKVTKGIRLLKSHGIELALSMVIGRHNVSKLTEEISFLVEEFNPISLGVNFMKPPTREQQDFAYLITPQEYVSALYQAFKAFRHTGLFFELVYRKVYPFVNRKFRYHDCGAAAGTTINIDAKGNIGPCKSFLVLDELAEDIKKQSEIFGTHLPVVEVLQKRSPFYHDGCQRCPAIAICGNACAYEAWVKSGNMMNIDMKACNYTQLFYREFLYDLATVMKPAHCNKSLHIPSQADRKRIFDNIVVDETTLSSSIGHATDE